MSERKPICEICGVQEKKYKCPKCSILYCSLSCYKDHQQDKVCSTRTETLAIAEVLKANKQLSGASSVGEGDQLDEGDKVDTASLSRLNESDTLKQLLRNTHLREYLIKLNSTSNPSRDIEKAMHEPIFLEFADECLNVIEPDRFT